MTFFTLKDASFCALRLNMNGTQVLKAVTKKLY